ncbi:MAG TPA: AAA family ATPase [Streptosporangiaceae bacterium]|nr:AAA family ATPase [Streptosporangiaceae bacterium]
MQHPTVAAHPDAQMHPGQVHYCQSCTAPVIMQPCGGAAWCPDCGRLDQGAAIEPLFVVTGASGSGKTAIFPALARLLTGRCVTFDFNWMLDAAGALSGGQPVAWPAFRDARLAVAHGIAQSGMPTVLLGPLIPGHLNRLANRRWVGEIHYLLLDCPDDLRRRRIEARPAWRRRDIEEQTAFAGIKVDFKRIP